MVNVLHILDAQLDLRMCYKHAISAVIVMKRLNYNFYNGIQISTEAEKLFVIISTWLEPQSEVLSTVKHVTYSWGTSV